MSDHVRVFDTTLRDGEQSPGATMSAGEKVQVARALRRLGVDIIEAGFPAASPDDLAAVRSIASEVGRDDDAPVICGLARAARRDIDAAWRALRDARYPRVHTFLATSSIHLEHKLKMTQSAAVERVFEMVSHASSFCGDVEFSAEDAARTDTAFLCEVIDAAVSAGARTINIPDTVGYATPAEYGALIARVREHLAGMDEVVVSVHCHDDLGLATANTLAGVRAGARQVEVTINGIGERAGNASLEEVVMALATRRDLFRMSTKVDGTLLCKTSRLVSRVTGMPVPANKAIVGANAFAHEAGIHQDGVLKRADTYEIMTPESVGAADNRLVLGKHSGRHALDVCLMELGHRLEPAAFDDLFDRFKRLADKKKTVTGADLEALVCEDGGPSPEDYALEAVQVACGTIGMPTATVRVRCPSGELRTQAAIGTGPVDALYKAIDAVVQHPCTLLEYAVHAVTEGIDALGEVSVRVRGEDRTTCSALCADSDVIVASAKAYLTALNRLVRSTTTSSMQSKLRDRGGGSPMRAVEARP